MTLKLSKLKVSKKYVLSWEKSIDLIAQLVDFQFVFVVRKVAESWKLIVGSKADDIGLDIDLLEKKADYLFEDISKSNSDLFVFGQGDDFIQSLNTCAHSEIQAFKAISLSTPNNGFFGYLCVAETRKEQFSEIATSALNELKLTIEKDLRFLKQEKLLNAEINDRKEIECELNAANEELKAGLERKHTEIDKISKDLKDIEEDYKLIVENQNALIVKFDKDFKLTYISPQYAKELGSNSNDLIGKSFFPFIHKDDIEQVKKSHEHLKKPPYECQHEERMKTINGWRWYYWSNKSIVNHTGEIEGVVAVGRDVTQRKKFEAELKESEERYDLAMKGTNDGIWDKDLVTGDIYFSKRWKTMLGYQEHELENSSETWKALAHPDDFKMSEKAKRAYLLGQKAKYEVEVRLKHKKGHWVNILSRGFKVMSDNGRRAIRFVGTHVDITKQRKAEDALRKSEAEFRRIIELNSIPMVVTNNKQDFLIVNKAFTKCFGYTLKDIPTGEIWWKTAYPDENYRKQVEMGWNRAVEDAVKYGTEIEKQIWEPTCKNGQKKIVEFAFVSLGEQNIITMVDITMQKLTENALKESEQKNRALSEAADEALFFSDRGVFVECNKAACELLGYTYEELIGISGIELIADEYKGFVLHKMMMGFNEPYEAIAKKKDGTKFWAEFKGSLYEYKGQKVRVTAVRDISDRKVAEEALVFSEEKFRAAFKTSPDSISINRMSDGTYVEINEGFVHSTGFSEEEVLGKTAEELNFWVNQSDKFKLLAILMQSGGCINFAAKFRIKNGKIINGLLSARTIILNNEKYLISITRDISDLKETEQELISAKEFAERKEKEYRSLFNEMLDGFALHEVIYNDLDIPVDYRFIELNPAYERMTGLKKEDVVNKTILEVTPDIEKHWITNFGKVGKTGEPYWFEDYVEELERYYTGIAYSPQQNYFAVIYSDATDKRKAEEIVIKNDEFLKEQNEEYQALNEQLTNLNLELLEAKQKAEESDNLKTAFLANMSHEIRTPMNGIMGFSGLLAKSNLTNEKKQKYIDIIKQNSHQLLSIINDLVDISKIEAGQIDIERDEVRLESLTKSLADLYYQKAIDKNIYFELDSKVADIQIVTDETKLRQILINLLDNAFKFTHQGEIKFGYEIKDGFIEFFVSDTGIGMEKEAISIIFERFRQVELSSARKYGGTGLGLSISKAFIEKMGGQIHVNSEINKGSKFYFTIPIKLTKEDVGHVSDNQVDELTLDWGNKVILVAEDELVNYRFFEEVFEGTRVNLIWAVNGQEAVEHCMVNKSIDLVLMDIKMPVLNGYDATEKIKKIRPELPIIAQTAYALIGDESKAKNAGCDDYIHKPIDSDELMKKIAHLLT
jgi:PAS domain S-box-containing protein